MTSCGLRLSPVFSATDAEAVVRRKFPAAVCDAQLVHHPFWWVQVNLSVTARLLKRRQRGRLAHVLVDAKSSTGFIAEFTPSGAKLTQAERDDFSRVAISATAASQIAHRLVSTAARRRFKLGVGLELIAQRPTPVLKPNWLVDASGAKHTGRVLVDGLDGSHWIISAQAR